MSGALRTCVKVGGALLAIIGFAGLPDDIATWSRWIDRIMRDDRILALAERAVHLAEFVNQSWVRLALVAIGLLIMLWSTAWLWRLRNRITFWVRHKMSDQVWVAYDDAFKVLQNSDWASLRSPHITRSIIGALPFEQTVSGLPERIKKEKRFRAFLSLTLKTFCNGHPNAVRQNENGDQEIDEVALKDWLDRALEKEVSDEFGGLPRA